MFTYKGKKSTEMYLRVLNDVEFTSPSRDVNLMQVPGRHGDLVMDNGRFNSVIRTIPCRLEAPTGVNVEECINNINNWLIDDGNFHEFTWDNDPEFRYLARVEGDVVNHRVLSRFGRTAVSFRLHPIKYLESSLVERQVTSGTNLENRFNVDAKPIIRIVGTGNITLTIGGRQLVLRGIGSGCIIDSESQNITTLNGQQTLFDRIYSDFPVLTPGNNVITFPAGVQVFVVPRLGRLV